MGVNKKEQSDVKRLLKASKEAQRKAPASAKLQKPKAGAKTFAELNQAGLHKKLRAMITSDEVGERPSVIEPPFTYEVHGKRQTLTVYVTLHKIPPQFIDISGTTDRKLVVDTTKYTKRYRLEFPFPSNMVVDAENGDYTLENGVLRAVFAITSMPKDVLQQTEKVIESVKAGRKLRFRYDENGDLKIRSRSTKIAVPKDKTPAKKPTDAADAKGGKSQQPESGKPSANRKRQREGEEGAPNQDGVADKKDANKSAFVDHNAAAKIAKVAAREASKELAKKTAEMHRRDVSTTKREERRDERRNLKSEKEASSFSSLLAEKKRALQERLALAAAPPRKQAASGKAVRFSQ